jgi:hypothetical protein
MSRRIDNAVWNERRELLQWQASSGISAARFCRENGISLSNFHAWKRKLIGAASVDWRMHSDGKSGPSDRRSSSFVQIPISSQPRSTFQPSWVEVSSAGGIVVRVPSGDLSALGTVLGALARERADA